MAKPKNDEERKIYEELLEKYKDDKVVLALIKAKYNNPTAKEDWQTTKEMLDWMP